MTLEDVLERVRLWFVGGGWTLRAGLLLVAAQLAMRGFQLWPGAYWQDDFRYLQTAREWGLSERFLLQDYHGHLMPAGFLLNWVVAQFPGSFLPAIVATLVLQGLASFLLLLMLRRMLGDSPGTVIGLALALFTPLSLASGLWWAAATQAIPLQLATCMAGYGMLRYLDERRRAWLAFALVGLLVGLAFWEKAVLIPGFLVLLTALHQGHGVADGVRAVLRQWRVWLAGAAITAVYLGWYLSSSSDDGAPIASLGQAVTVIRSAVLDTFLVGSIGGPWSGAGFFPTGYPQPTTLVVLVALAGAAAVLGWGLVMRRGAIWLPCLALAVYLAADVALLAWARGYWGGFLARDPRYLADALPLTALVVGMLFTSRRPPGREVHAIERLNPRVVTVASCMLVVSSLVTAGVLVPPLQHRPVSAYIDHARRATAADPGLVLYDGPVPEALMLHTFGEPALVSTVLGAYDLHPRYNRVSERLMMLDDHGVPRRIRLVFEQAAIPTEVPDCGLELEGGRTRALTLGDGVGKGRWVMRIDYYAGASTIGLVRTGGQQSTFRFSPGLHSTYFTVEGPFPTASVTNQGEETVCIPKITVGFPLPETS